MRFGLISPHEFNPEPTDCTESDDSMWSFSTLSFLLHHFCVHRNDFSRDIFLEKVPSLGAVFEAESDVLTRRLLTSVEFELWKSFFLEGVSVDIWIHLYLLKTEMFFQVQCRCLRVWYCKSDVGDVKNCFHCVFLLI